MCLFTSLWGLIFIPCSNGLQSDTTWTRIPNYTKQTLITMESIKLSSTTDRYTTMTRSTTPAPFSMTIGEPPLIAIGNHQHQSSAWIHHHPWTWPYSLVFSSAPTLIGNSFYELVTTFLPADLHLINSRYVSKDTCPKMVSTHAPQFWSIKSLMLRNSLQ